MTMPADPGVAFASGFAGGFAGVAAFHPTDLQSVPLSSSGVTCRASLSHHQGCLSTNITFF